MSADLKCAECGKWATEVIDTRDGKSLGNTIRRRRRCLLCGHRFTSYELTGEDLKPFKLLAKLKAEVARLAAAVEAL